jgi:hypothetical protein
MGTADASQDTLTTQRRPVVDTADAARRSLTMKAGMAAGMASRVQRRQRVRRHAAAMGCAARAASGGAATSTVTAFWRMNVEATARKV